MADMLLLIKSWRSELYLWYKIRGGMYNCYSYWALRLYTLNIVNILTYGIHCQFRAHRSCTKAICCHPNSHTTKRRVSAGYSCSPPKHVGHSKNNILTFTPLFFHMTVGVWAALQAWIQQAWFLCCECYVIFSAKVMVCPYNGTGKLLY